jgi:hypothetical protein
MISNRRALTHMREMMNKFNREYLNVSKEPAASVFRVV